MTRQHWQWLKWFTYVVGGLPVIVLAMWFGFKLDTALDDNLMEVVVFFPVFAIFAFIYSRTVGAVAEMIIEVCNAKINEHSVIELPALLEENTQEKKSLPPSHKKLSNLEEDPPQ